MNGIRDCVASKKVIKRTITLIKPKKTDKTWRFVYRVKRKEQRNASISAAPKFCLNNTTTPIAPPDRKKDDSKKRKR
jgi:hypothetical protein